MPEIELSHGCIAREMSFAIDTGSAQALGRAIADGFSERMKERDQVGGGPVGGDVTEELNELRRRDAARKGIIDEALCSEAATLRTQVSELCGFLDTLVPSHHLLSRTTRESLISVEDDKPNGWRRTREASIFIDARSYLDEIKRETVSPPAAPKTIRITINGKNYEVCSHDGKCARVGYTWLASKAGYDATSIGRARPTCVYKQTRSCGECVDEGTLTYGRELTVFDGAVFNIVETGRA